MSLRIILKPDQVAQWIADRHGRPARRRGSETDVCICFGEPGNDFELITVDELLDAMKVHHLVMLVEQQPGSTYHKLFAHS